jgi:hypothetical protein
MDHTPTIENQRGFIRQDHVDCPVGRSDIDRLKVCVQYKDRFIHQYTIMIITVLIWILRGRILAVCSIILYNLEIPTLNRCQP